MCVYIYIYIYISIPSWSKLHVQKPATYIPNPPNLSLGGSKIWPHGALLGSKTGSEIDYEANKHSMGYGGVPGGQGGGLPLLGGLKSTKFAQSGSMRRP